MENKMIKQLLYGTLATASLLILFNLDHKVKTPLIPESLLKEEAQLPNPISNKFLIIIWIIVIIILLILIMKKPKSNDLAIDLRKDLIIQDQVKEINQLKEEVKNKNNILIEKEKEIKKKEIKKKENQEKKELIINKQFFKIEKEKKEKKEKKDVAIQVGLIDPTRESLSKKQLKIKKQLNDKDQKILENSKKFGDSLKKSQETAKKIKEINERRISNLNESLTPKKQQNLNDSDNSNESTQVKTKKKISNHKLNNDQKNKIKKQLFQSKKRNNLPSEEQENINPNLNYQGSQSERKDKNQNLFSEIKIKGINLNEKFIKCKKGNFFKKGFNPFSTY